MTPDTKPCTVCLYHAARLSLVGLWRAVVPFRVVRLTRLEQRIPWRLASVWWKCAARTVGEGG